MRIFLPVGVLIAAMAWGQANSAAPASNPTPAPSSTVAPGDAVLTIKGLCDRPAPDAAAPSANSNCETVVTRAQFDELLEMLRVEKDPQATHQLVSAYPQLLMMAHEAEQRGVEKEQRFQERLRFARMQILSQELVRHLKEEAAQVPAKDIADYYQKHPNEFEEASLERVVIPIRAGDKSEDAIAKEAELLHTRAAQGEDFAKLQKEAYEFAGVSGNTEPSPSMGKMRRRGLPPAHASVFDLKPGEVSPVITDQTGRYIYKLDSRGIEPLDNAEVTKEITNTLRTERLQSMVKAIQQPFTTDVNHAYFGAIKGGGKD